MSSSINRWLVRPLPQPQARLRLFCFAFAGGSAWIFRPWAAQLAQLLSEPIDICAIELPGRGKRLAEPPITSLADLIPTLGAQLLPLLDRPFAFFGHSMGALIAFELCHWLRQTVQLIPAHLWVSAARAPQLAIEPPLMHRLSKADFIDRLQHYQGTPISVLNNAELMDLMLPVLRADFTLLETYQYQPKGLLDCPITGLWGQQDNIVSQAEVAAWRVHTLQFDLSAISGDHFFMQQSLFIETLLPRLNKLVRTNSIQ
ncbi:MAG: alpha/beta fold hydrolase [Cyanobacteria bacterium J06623_5]